MLRGSPHTGFLFLARRDLTGLDLLSRCTPLSLYTTGALRRLQLCSCVVDPGSSGARSLGFNARRLGRASGHAAVCRYLASETRAANMPPRSTQALAATGLPRTPPRRQSNSGAAAAAAASPAADKKAVAEAKAGAKFDEMDEEGVGYLAGPSLGRMAEWVWESYHGVDGRRCSEEEKVPHASRHLWPASPPKLASHLHHVRLYAGGAGGAPPSVHRRGHGRPALSLGVPRLLLFRRLGPPRVAACALRQVRLPAIST